MRALGIESGAVDGRMSSAQRLYARRQSSNSNVNAFADEWLQPKSRSLKGESFSTENRFNSSDRMRGSFLLALSKSFRRYSPLLSMQCIPSLKYKH